MSTPHLARISNLKVYLTYKRPLALLWVQQYLWT